MTATRPMHSLVSSSVLLALLLTPGTPSQTQAAPAPSRSLEQQLLEDLDTNPLAPEVQRDLRKPNQTTPSAKPPAEPKPAEPSKPDPKLQSQLSRELGAAAVSQGDDALLDIVYQMQQAKSLIEQAQAGQETQRVQAGILTSLDELLKAARSQKQQCPAGPDNKKGDTPRQTPNSTSSKPSSKPSGEEKTSTAATKDTQAKPGKSGAHRPDMAEMTEVLKNVWGELPAHEREQMLELPMEEFLPKYELLIESYFKRLAEEQGRQ